MFSRIYVIQSNIKKRKASLYQASNALFTYKFNLDIVIPMAKLTIPFDSDISLKNIHTLGKQFFITNLTFYTDNY